MRLFDFHTLDIALNLCSDAFPKIKESLDMSKAMLIQMQKRASERSGGHLVAGDELDLKISNSTKNCTSKFNTPIVSEHSLFAGQLSYHDMTSLCDF